MCGSSTATHKVLGQRLNQSQGFRPKKKTGISVSVMRCTNCGLVYSNPQPVPADLQDHYGVPAESYWKPEYFVWDASYFSTQIETVKTLLPFQKGMKALDIGAGIGKAMLSLEHAGFETFGFEPSESFYEKAISNMHIHPDKIQLGAIETLDYPESHFDFITFGAVFEHVYDPKLCLEKALTWLKPGGIIHIEVPSSDWLITKHLNWYYRLIGTNYVTNLSPMHAPFHLHEFTAQSFHKLNSSHQIKVELVQHDVCDVLFVPQFLHPLYRWYMKKFKKGMQLTVYLRKQ